MFQVLYTFKCFQQLTGLHPHITMRRGVSTHYFASSSS
nr:MAG TPA: hypothetical protein [Caudoviricetes sp.]